MPFQAHDTTNNALTNEQHQLPALASQTTKDNPWPVSMLSSKYASAVDRWPAAWVSGQVHQINARRAGQVYMTLRDNDSPTQMDVVFFGAPAYEAARFQQGDLVVVHGKANIYQPRTSLSLRADEIHHVGRGGLMEQIEQLRKKLKGEGLFDDSRKVEIPHFPHKIGLICAPGARAEGDVITNARLRWPSIEFETKHVHVQGPQCPPEVITAIAELDADITVDVIVVARGGGAFEDLIGFSDEGVVRAAANCVTPLVSAIGHEDDWTLIDLAADLRASTPTDAAKRIVPDIREEMALVAEARRRSFEAVQRKIDVEHQRLSAYSNRPSLTHPQTILDKPLQFVADARLRIQTAMNFMTADATSTIDRLHATLTALSPQSTLNRGYAVIQSTDGTVIDSSSVLTVGDSISITLKSGSVHADVSEILP
ncbi:exodeoxyribonuclease VII large subunit [Alloscardovia theropitheci]|uniref:Exodeoxyribonuclease 7 large subunit n=1 Tax=Alloscardovia theropitheci TaxID=2496842 RepID=A0A4R0R0A9_9BIFI|nr:exodeoxyribonuclease VII large subunit [Alloscardovia theropitheci]TCD54446.1 exodeoxyribonuclease VII large subunit [Alloscardovia theropitheci]